MWNLFYYINNNNGPNECIINYIELYNKISNKQELSFVDKSMILISFDERIFESNKTFNIPKLYFYNELDDRNPYKIAYNFQYEIIEKLSEQSCLFLPFLVLDSYIMDCIYSKNYKFIKEFKSAYSLSMIPLESIKNHLKKTIKNYFFVLEKGEENERKYYASVHKYNFLVTYNENIILRNSKYLNICNCQKYYEEDECLDLAFIINFENLHENFSHNKEELLNIKKSPTLYFNLNFQFSFIYHYDTEEYGEAGRFVETFIGKEILIEEMKKPKYKMGKFLKVEYYVDKNFDALLKGFREVYNNYNTKKKNLDNIKGESNNTNLISNYSPKTEDETKKEDPCDNNINTKNQNTIEEKIQFNNNNISNSIQVDNETIYLSKYNTYVLTADSLEGLIKKVEEMKKKTIIKRKDSIENINQNCNY